MDNDLNDIHSEDLNIRQSIGLTLAGLRRIQDALDRGGLGASESVDLTEDFREDVDTDLLNDQIDALCENLNLDGCFAEDRGHESLNEHQAITLSLAGLRLLQYEIDEGEFSLVDDPHLEECFEPGIDIDLLIDQIEELRETINCEGLNFRSKSSDLLDPDFPKTPDQPESTEQPGF